MKIAIAFLLLGLSSSLDTANGLVGTSGGLQSCPKSIGLSNLKTLATMVAKLVAQYEGLKAHNMQDSDEKVCLLDQVFSIVKLVADFKGCSAGVIVDEVMLCLDLPAADKRTVRTAFETNNPALAARVNARIDVLIAAICCTAHKIAASEGLNFIGIFNGLLPNLTNLLGPLLGAVTGTLNSILGLAGSLLGSVTGILGGGDGGIVGNILGGLLQA
ncbi:hypothetical protein GDO81_010633 [Engystomops pustulosus]|uniref:Secreted protein n=1 Tax=Engystomops pustulosus TaxID=76066 RepID=A0AAV7C1H6_ENGPU|nr:hypothetical protein GDO81_010633 [Engystomops pustulosus]